MKRLLMGSAMVLILTAGGFAQQTSSGPQGQRMNPLSKLTTALNLTSAQVSAIQSLVQTSQQQSKTITSDLKTKRTTFNSLVSATSPSPTDVGNAALAVHADEVQLQNLRNTLISGIRNTLTSDQQATFDTLVNAGLPIPGLGFGPGSRGMRGPRGGGQ